MRALSAYFILFLALGFSLISLAKPEFGWLVPALLCLLVWLLPHAQKGQWFGGWHAAHSHHKIMDADSHVKDYRNFVARSL